MKILFLILIAGGDGPRPEEAGVVCRIKVCSDKVPDVSDLESWAKSFLRPGMTDEEKALAVWKTVRTFQHQDSPPVEHLQHEEVVQDPLKVFHVYGYGFCSMAACAVEALARHAGLQARGRIIRNHSVPEVFYDGGWHLLDASLLCWFPRADGKAASVDEIIEGVREWYGRNPGFRNDERKLREFMRAGGWRKGPEVLSRCPHYDENGWLPAATHGWYSTMQEYDCPPGRIYEYGYSQGYRLNLSLRPGERLVRNWSNKGLHVNLKGGGGAPGCLRMRTGQDSLRYTPADGDLAPGRVGNGTLEWEVPLKGEVLRRVALEAENLTAAAAVRDPSRPALLVLRMPSSYVYLTGKASLRAAVGPGGSVTVSFSDNHGLDWKEVASFSEAGPRELDLGELVHRRYDYRLRFELRGAGTALEALRLVHDIQHSQRPLPALDRGSNIVTFEAGPPEGTITVEGSTNLKNRGRQLVYTDFHPEVNGLGEPNLFLQGERGDIAFPVAVPGDLVRLRFGAHYRARDARDGWDYQVSFDDGKTWRTVDRAAGPTPGNCRYTVFSEVPPGTRRAKVRFAGTSRNATGIFDFRIDADYREPAGGFRPVKVTYLWEEEGEPREHVHVARRPQESWTISCAARPVMRSIVLELEEPR